jgi:tetratricopeptide (TPR) repeat protein
MRYREYDARLPAVRRSLQNDPGDAAAWVTLREWYAFRRQWAWAVEAFGKGRACGADVNSVLLAQCLWQVKDREGARREFRRALERGEAPADYLRLCLKALDGPPAIAVSTASTFGGTGDFEAAVRDFDARVAAGPTGNLTYFDCALLHAYLGHENAYRDVCRKMRTVPWHHVRYDDEQMIARTCLLLAPVREDPAELLRLATVGLEKSPDASWAWYAVGLAHLRSGNSEAAVQSFESALSGRWHGGQAHVLPQTWLVLAIAHAGAGRNDEARRAFEHAEQLVKPLFKETQNGTVQRDWTQWLEFQIFRREAEGLIGRKPAHVVDPLHHK